MMNWLSDKTIDHLRNVSKLPDLSQTKYRCVQKIARGGMGSVYLAEDSQLKRKVALKVLDTPDPDGSLAARMMQEARVIALLEHPSIVPIHDVGTLPDGRVFYTMKFVKGWRLDEQVSRASSLTSSLGVFQKICEAVAFAHAHNVIHRDLKPENIMVADFGEVLVMDWGLAKVLSIAAPEQNIGKNSQRRSQEQKVDKHVKAAGPSMPSESLTEHGTIMGTPEYMAPEQQGGQIDMIDQRTDIYALGAILDFIIHAQYRSKPTRDRPVWGALLGNRARKPQKQLLAISEKAMSYHRDDRYAEAMDLAEDVENFLNGERVSVYKENLLEISWRWIRQYKFLILLILVYVLAKLIILFVSNL